ncbi:MAG: pantoate--beta-alanine ligase [Bacteroidota bacterium]
MKVIYTNEALALSLSNIKGDLGFVPTMGALHIGHISLIERSVSENKFTICSIFINQKQFNNKEDFEKYPKSIDTDLAKLEQAKCDIVFIPTNEQIYPTNFKASYYELGNIENVLEGFYRPGHFQGVCIVVNRLLDLIKPNKMYLGRKDFQQCIVIQKMLVLQKLDSKIELCIVSTKRDQSGLALSSRNLRLSEEAKRKSLILISCLENAKASLLADKNADIIKIQKDSIKEIKKAGFESVDYFDFINENFEVLKNNTESKRIIAILTAATIDAVRLIDNIEI